MKLLIKSLGIAFAFSLITCTKATHPPNTILTGSWIVTEFILKDCIDSSSNTDEICNGKCDTFTFYSTTFTDIGTFTNSGTYSIKENNLTLTYTGNAPIVTTYALKNDTLTMTFPALSTADKRNGCVEITKSVKQK